MSESLREDTQKRIESYSVREPKKVKFELEGKKAKS